jgi:hypothetical protein
MEQDEVDDYVFGPSPRDAHSDASPPLCEITSLFAELPKDQQAEIVNRLDRLGKLTAADFSRAKVSETELKQLKKAEKSHVKFEAALNELSKEAPHALGLIFSEYMGKLITRSALSELIGESIPTPPKPRAKRGRPPNAPDTRQEAGELPRSLIDEIRLVPQGEVLGIHLKGELAEMLAISTNKKLGSKGTELKITLVAGGRYQRCLHLDEVWL